MSPIRQARENAGLSLEEVAHRLGRSVDYLRQVEGGGRCSFRLGMRLAYLYKCSANVFLTKGGKGRLDTALRDRETSRHRPGKK